MWSPPSPGLVNHFFKSLWGPPGQRTIPSADPRSHVSALALRGQILNGFWHHTLCCASCVRAVVFRSVSYGSIMLLQSKPLNNPTTSYALFCYKSQQSSNFEFIICCRLKHQQKSYFGFIVLLQGQNLHSSEIKTL